MAVADVPNSFKDPYWSDLASNVEAKLELPKGLLSAIVTRGERSNADQVSEAGAKSPFQIIPSTRAAALDKYGIDAYLSPQNAAEVAGLLLKDSLGRNKGSVPLAVAEYHGGTDRAQWGPRTTSYVQRVTGALPPADGSIPAAPNASPGGAPALSTPMAGPSTFDRVSAQMAKPSEPQIANVFAAYQGGQMNLQEAQQFEADVKAGHIMLPRGAALKDAGGAPAARGSAGPANVLPAAVIEAYVDGRMSPAERAQLEGDVASGAVQPPAGITITPQPKPGFVDRVKEAITGEQRATPETQSLPDWAAMPELNSASMASAKTGLGTLLSNPAETVKIIQANFPGVQARQDENGNFLLRSSVDGQEYAIKPGFAMSDLPRALGGIAAFTPAGRAATTIPRAVAAGAATQAAIEGTQAAAGGDFNTREVVDAGLMSGAVPVVGRVLETAAQPAKALITRALGRQAPALAPEMPAAAPGAAVAPANPGVPAVAPAAPVAAPAAVAPALSAAELAATAKTAAEGGMSSGRATRVLAEQAAPDAKTVEAAQRLGIQDYLQPDHVTTNQAYRELAQAVKSVPGSQARAAELQGLDTVAQRADRLVEEVGGTADLSTLDASVKGRMQATQAQLEQQANKLYEDLRTAVPAKTGAPARNVLDFVDQRAKDLGGAENLTPMEKQILGKLTPKPVRNGNGEVVGKTQPTYALLDDVRKDLGAAARAGGPFKDADTGLAKKLYSLLSDDQAAVVERMGMGDTYKAARQAVAVRKGLEDDMASLFGKQLDGSMVGQLSGAVSALPKGDASKLVKLLAAVPEDMRQNVVASGLASAFGKNARNGAINFNSYASWFEGLARNKQAYAAVMSNLPPAARKQLSDLYRVSKGIGAATRERITTGRIQAVQQELQGVDSLMGNVFSLARRSAGGIAAEAITTPLGLPGTGLSAGIASALAKGKPNALKAADALIASPEFVQMARSGGNPAAVRALAYSKPFTRFVRAIGQPRELSNRERWVLQAMQAQNQQRQ
jgi:hypothetical protein